MNLTRLAIKNINGSSFRSWVVALCAFLVASFAVATTLIIRGAENSLNLVNNRLGADILVVPDGAETKVASVLLMGTPTDIWMPIDKLKQIAAIPGVAIATPQLYLSTLHGASCCSVSDMFLVAYDPATDFTIQPWLKQKVGTGLRLGEAVGGTFVFVPEGEQNIQVYGYSLTLRANIESTGTGLDQSLFFTFDTAYDVARLSKTLAQKPLVIPPNSISAVLIKLAPNAISRDVAVQILRTVPGVTPIESPNLFQSYRAQILSLLRSILIILVITWIISVLMIGLVFSMAAYERRRELGVLRAMGATRSFVFRSLLYEAGILALLGGGIGATLISLTIYLFRTYIIKQIGIPFIFPTLPTLLGQICLGLLLALISVSLASMIPAYKISHQDPAAAMRE